MSGDINILVSVVAPALFGTIGMFHMFSNKAIVVMRGIGVILIGILLCVMAIVCK